MTPSWFDARGCLSTEGVSALRATPPGAAPAELAGHLASCPRCQQRLLSLESVPRKGRRSADLGKAWRTLTILAFVVLLMLLGMFVTSWRIGG